MRFLIVCILFVVMLSPSKDGRVDANDSAIAIAEIRRPDPVDFDAEVLPILQRNCLACHNEREPQGGLVLETPEHMRKGGDNGPALIPNRGAESLLVKLAARQSDPVMPPDGNDVNAKPLTSQELGLLRLWIDQGARQSKSNAVLSPQSLGKISSRIAPVYSLDLTDDGQHLAVSRANRLYLYHVPTGRLVTQLFDPAISADSNGDAPSPVAHRDLIQSLAFNRDGDLLASGSFREVKLWRRPIDVTILNQPAKAPITAIAISPDRNWIATAVEHEIRITDTRTGAPVHSFTGHTDRIVALRFAHPDRLVSASIDQSIRFWDTNLRLPAGVIETPAAIHALELTALSDDADQVDRSAKRQQIVTAGPDKLIRTWNSPTTASIRWPVIPNGLQQVTFSHDKKWIALGRNDGMIVIMKRGDDGDFKPVLSLKHPDAPPVASCFLNSVNGDTDDASPDDLPSLVTSSATGIVRVWSLKHQEPARIWQTGPAEVTTLAASLDGAWLATGAADGAVSLWNTKIRPSQPFAQSTGNAVAVVAKNRANDRLAVAGRADGKPSIFVYDLAGNQLLHTLHGHTAPINALNYAADNRRILSSSDDGTIRIWNPEDTQQTEQHRLEGLPSTPTALALSTDGTQLVAAMVDHNIGIWRLADQTLSHQLAGHTDTIVGIGYSGNDLYSISADRSVRFWKTTDGSQIRSFNSPSNTTAWAITDDASKLALASADNVIRIYQFSDGQLTHTIPGLHGPASSLCFATDGKRLVATVAATGRRGETSVWDLAQTTARRIEVWPASDVTFAAFVQSADELVFGDHDGNVGKRSLQFARFFEGNANRITALAFHANHQTLYVGASDGALRGYSIAGGQQAFATTHGASIEAIALSPNGQVLLTGGENGVLKMWQSGGGPFGPQQITGIEAPIRNLVVTGDNNRVVVAVGGSNPHSVVYDLNSAAPIQKFTLNRQPVLGLATMMTSSGPRPTPTPATAAPVVEPNESTEPNESILSISADAVWQWSIQSDRVLAGHTAEIHALASIPGQSHQIVSAGSDGTIRFWNLENGQVFRQLNHGANVVGLAVRPDGQRIASVSENRTIKLWNITGQTIAEMRGDIRLKANVARLTFQQASLTSQVNASKQRLEAAQKDAPLKPQAAEKAAEALLAATQSLADKQSALDKSAKEKLVAEQEAIAAATAARAAVVAKAAADDAFKSASETLKNAVQRSTQLAAIASAMPNEDAIQSALTEANQSVVAAQTVADQLQMAIQVPAEKLQTATAAAIMAAERAAALQKPYNDLLAESKTLIAAKNLADQQHQVALREWKAAEDRTPAAQKALTDAEMALETIRQQLVLASQDAVAAELPIRSAAFSPDGSVLATAGDFQNLHTWDAETGAAIAAFAGHQDRLTGVAFIDDERMATISADHSLRVWQRNPSWKLERIIGSVDQPAAISHRVTSLDFSPDSHSLLVAGGVPSRNGEVAIFRVNDAQRTLWIPQAHDDVIHDAKFSPDGQRFATAGADKYMRTYDVETAEMLRRFEGHTNYVLGLDWKGDGQVLATASADHTVKVWDADTGDQRRTISNFEKHVTQVRFVGDSDNVVSSSGDRAVRMHNSQNGGNVRSFNGATAWLHCCDISTDSKVVAAGTQSGMVHIWNGLNGQSLNTIAVGAEENDAVDQR